MYLPLKVAIKSTFNPQDVRLPIYFVHFPDMDISGEDGLKTWPKDVLGKKSCFLFSV